MSKIKKIETRIHTIEVGGYLSVKQAASILSKSYGWLYQRIGKIGGPPHKRIGGQFAIPTEDFIKWSQQDHIL